MKVLRFALISAVFGVAPGGSLPAAAAEVDHSQMDHSQLDHAHADPVHAGHEDAPRTPIPVLTEADRLAAMPPAMSHMEDDHALHSYTLLNQLETWDDAQGAGLGWEAEGWIGGDINRLWWRSEGERVDGRTQSANLEALFGHSFLPRWDWMVGLRQDARPRASRSYLSLGVRGLAPQWLEVSAVAYVGEGGRTAARLSSGYSLLLTNRLVLQPQVELNLYGRDDTSRGIGSGLATAEAGLRLRYEFTRQLAPYLGVNWDRAFGDTARLRRAAGGAVSDTRLLVGIRIWF